MTAKVGPGFAKTTNDHTDMKDRNLHQSVLQIALSAYRDQRRNDVVQCWYEFFQGSFTDHVNVITNSGHVFRPRSSIDEGQKDTNDNITGKNLSSLKHALIRGFYHLKKKLYAPVLSFQVSPYFQVSFKFPHSVKISEDEFLFKSGQQSYRFGSAFLHLDEANYRQFGKLPHTIRLQLEYPSKARKCPRDAIHIGILEISIYEGQNVHHVVSPYIVRKQRHIGMEMSQYDVLSTETNKKFNKNQYLNTQVYLIFINSYSGIVSINLAERVLT